jgi:hypothetical protein
VGGTTYYTAKYDPDGHTGSLAEQDVTLTSAWSAQPGSIASYSGTGTVSGQPVARFTGLQPGEATVGASYNGLIAEADLTVFSNQLSVVLTAEPDQGPAPLLTTLTATVFGTQTGTINYNFWWNCNYTGNNLVTAMNLCGDPANGENGAKFDGVSSETQSVEHGPTYQSIGSYQPKVIVQRSFSRAAASAGVTVTTTPPPTDPETHAECFNSACVQVDGAGDDRCSVNADCGGGGGPFHSECIFAQQACVNVSGPGPSTCGTDFNCSGVTASHLACDSNSCVIRDGAGPNTGGCTVVGAACTPLPPGPPGGETDCTFTATPTLIARGGFSKLQWFCGSGIAACTITDESTGASVASGGPVNQEPGVSVSPLKTTNYRITCDSGVFTESITVRVLSITEVPPR